MDHKRLPEEMSFGKNSLSQSQVKKANELIEGYVADDMERIFRK